MKTLHVLVGLMLIANLALAQSIQGDSKPVMVDTSPLAAVKTNPVIIWISPNLPSSSVTVKKMIIKVGINSTIKLKNVQLLINGLSPDESRGFAPTNSDATKFAQYIEKEVDLSNGPTEIKIIAENEKGESTIESRMVNVDVPVIAASARTNYALLFATDDYNEWNGLVNPIFDAQTIANELKGVYGFSVEFIKNPTKSEFLRKMREYSSKNYLPEDQLFIFVAGHGKFDEIEKDGYLVLKDSKKGDDTNETYVPYSQLKTQVDNNPNKHIFLVLDACFSGTFDQMIAKRGEDDAELQDKMVARDEFINQKLKLKTRMFLTSGQKEYVSDGKKGKHSPFASKFVEALRTYGGGNKMLSSSSIFYSYMLGMKPQPHFGTFGDNDPGSEFFFIAK